CRHYHDRHTYHLITPVIQAAYKVLRSAYAVHILPFFFFDHTTTPEIYTLSLHDALPICTSAASSPCSCTSTCAGRPPSPPTACRSESTRLNSSHVAISYAVFCLKKKKAYERPKRQEQRNGNSDPSRAIPRYHPR